MECDGQRGELFRRETPFEDHDLHFGLRLVRKRQGNDPRFRLPLSGGPIVSRAGRIHGPNLLQFNDPACDISGEEDPIVSGGVVGTVYVFTCPGAIVSLSMTVGLCGVVDGTG
jgi:hypothetical protein